jgi:hypothetical protein
MAWTCCPVPILYVLSDSPSRLPEISPRLRTLFSWGATTNAPRVRLDLSQSSVERVIRPALYAGHRLERMAVRVDRKTIGGVLPDVPHRTAEQVRQPPSSAALFRDDNHIHRRLT